MPSAPAAKEAPKQRRAAPEIPPPAPPSLWYLLMETRALQEWRAGNRALDIDGLELPRGDGHGVLLLPGFFATDRSMALLARVLRQLGYRTYRSGLNPNLGPTRGAVGATMLRVQELHRRCGRPISLLGHSAGGIFAREVARVQPSMVRMVITLATPLRDFEHTRASRLAAALRRWWIDDSRGRDVSAPIPLPTTAIYSKTDGIVPWRSCVEEDGPQRESIEVETSHIGMTFDPSVFRIVADRLALDLRSWRPYQSGDGIER